MTRHKLAVISADGMGVQLTEAALAAVGWPDKLHDSVLLLGLLPMPKVFVERGLK